MQRRKDIIHYLTANMPRVFGFFLENLESLYSELSNEHAEYLIRSCLNCLIFYVDWINIDLVFSKDFSLINICLTLLHHQSVSNEAAKCLLVVLSRKGSLPDRKPLLNLLNDFLISKIYESIKKSLADPNFKHLLKHLVQILIAIGVQLNFLWQDSSFIPPFDLNSYFNSIYELVICENRLFSAEAVQLWTSLISNKYIKENSTIKISVLNLAKVMTNSKLLFKPSVEGQIEDEFSSDEDVKKFIQKYRNDLSKLIKQSGEMFLEEFVASGCDWARTLLTETRALPINDQSGYDTTSFLFQCWDAIIFYFNNLMPTVIRKTKATNDNISLKSQLISLLQISIEFESLNANYISYNLSLLSSTMFACEFGGEPDRFVRIVLKKLFDEFTHFQTNTFDTTIIKHVNNLRRQIAANILNVCKRYSLLVLPLFEELYARCNSLINSTQCTQIERVIFVQSLLFCSNELSSYELQVGFINQLMQPVLDFFANKTFRDGICSPRDFVSFFGLSDSKELLGLNNRCQLFYYENFLFGALKSVQLRDDGKNPAFASFAPIFDDILRLFKTLTQLHSNEIHTHLFSVEYIEMTDAAKILALGLNTQTTQTHTQLGAESNEKTQMFIYNSYDILSQLIALYLIKFKNELLMTTTTENNYELIVKFGDALFSNFTQLPDFRVRYIVRYVLKACVNFQFKVDQAGLNLLGVKLAETMLEFFLPSILTRVTEKVKCMQSRGDLKDQEDLNSVNIQNQIIEENQFTLLCRDIVELLKELLINIKESDEDDEQNESSNEDGKINPVGETSQISDLAIHLFKNNRIVFQSVILVLFEGINWPDSQCCLRLVRLGTCLLESSQLGIDNLRSCLNDGVGEQMFKYCLNALQLHGEHQEIANALINLSFLIYEKFPESTKVLFNSVLRTIPVSNVRLFDEFMASCEKNTKSAEKNRKDLFRKIVQPVVGKSVGQLYKNEIEIRLLQPLDLKIRRKFADSDTQVNICALFDPNN